MAIYNAYLEGAEREAAILEMELDNQYDKLLLLYEISCKEVEQVKKDLELKVFRENGTYDDLEYLISEAEAQAAQDQGNVLTEIFNWFRRLFNTIITGIKNLFSTNKVDPNTQVEMVEDPNEQTQNKVFNSIMNTINSAQDENSILGLPKMLAGAIAAVAAGATIGGIFVLNRAGKKKKTTVKEVQAEDNAIAKNATKAITAIDQLEGLRNKFANVPMIGQIIVSITDTCTNYLKPIATFFKDKSDYLQELIKSAGAVAAPVVQGVKDAAGNVVNTVKGAVGGNNANIATNNTATPQQGAVADTVKGAQLNSGRNGIVATVIDAGKTRKINLTGDGKVTNAEDKQAISPAIRQLVEGSPAVAGAVQRYKKGQELLAKKNTNPQPATQPAPANNTQPQANTTQPAKESIDVEELNLGDMYAFETTDDGFIISINTVIECPEDYLTTTQSIFGIIAEQEAAEDPEFEELQKLFSEL